MPRFVIMESERAELSPALPLIYEGINELVQEGHATWAAFAVPTSAADHVLYAISSIDQDVIGVICYGVDVDLKVITVTLIYVEHSSRKQGVCAALWAALLDRAKRLEFTVTVGPVHAENTVAQNVLHKFNCAPLAMTYIRRPNSD